MLSFKCLDMDHGRIATGEATICRDIRIPKGLHHGPGLEVVGKVKARCEIEGISGVDGMPAAENRASIHARTQSAGRHRRGRMKSGWANRFRLDWAGPP
ncbi:MAG: hypothetical protein OXC26_24045 [Albidovulum sp.]|nr:hypothetical protein [Albidovulum sp.]